MMYVTDFFSARISTMLRTRRSILRSTLRHFRRLIRAYEELREQSEEQLQDAKERGDVDATLKSYEEAIKRMIRFYRELGTEEKNVFMAEVRNLKEPQEVAKLLGEVEDELRKLENDPRLKSFAEGLRKEFITGKNSPYQHLLELEEKIRSIERLQYKDVLRQEKREEGVLQEFVLTPSHVMNAVNQLWNLKGDVRKEQHALKELESYEERIFKELVELLNASRKGETEKVRELEERLRSKDEKQLEKDIGEFLDLYTRLFKEYLLFTKDAAHIFFMFRKEDEFLKDFLEALKAEGFPEAEAKAITEELKGEDKKIHEIFHTLANVYRRGARIYEQQLSVKDAI